MWGDGVAPTVQVLDEADEMLNKGFADDVEHLMEGMPTGTDRPQTLLFSATEPPWVKQLAKKNLVNHHAVDLVGNSKVKLAEGITNVAVTATARQRSTMLADLITLYRSQHAIVFVNTKREADELVAELGIIMKGTEALHGDIPQGAREKILNGFRSGRIPVLIATDVAARGLDIDHVDLVVHHGVPQSVENFIHRSGRTGRAGRKGTSLVLYDKNEQWSLNRIEKDAGIKFEKRGAPQPDEVMEASAWRAAANLATVNPELEPYFVPMAEKLMQDVEDGGVSKLAQALAWMSGYKAPPSKRSLLTGEDELRTVLLKPDDSSGGPLEVRDVMRIVSGCLAAADPQELSAADTRIGRIARCQDGSAVIDISPKGAQFLAASLKSYEGSRFFAPGLFSMPEELPDLFEEQRRGGYGGRGGGGCKSCRVSSGAWPARGVRRAACGPRLARRGAPSMPSARRACHLARHPRRGVLCLSARRRGWLSCAPACMPASPRPAACCLPKECKAGGAPGQHGSGTARACGGGSWGACGGGSWGACAI